jgi:two-component system, LytTR family, sensor kinase
LGVPVATVVAAAIAVQTYLSMLDHGHSFARIFAWQWISWIFWALAAPFVLRAGRAWLRLAILGVVLIAAHAALTAGATVLVQPYQPLRPSPYGRAFVMQMKWLLPIDLMAYLWLGLVAGALRLQDKTRRLELRESHLEGDLARAQLEVLRLEIQPHFLFNTLNAISALIRLKANDRALEMLVGLSELMRYTLDRSGDQMMPLEMEVDFIRRYVGIQQARFGDRLHVEFDIADECRTVPLPTFILQPIVENAIRHGVAGVSRPCRIEVRATVDQDATLRVSIGDDGMGLPPGFSLERDAHTGLRNAAARLQRLYGAGAGLRVTARPGGGTVTEVWLPLRFEAAASATA